MYLKNKYAAGWQKWITQYVLRLGSTTYVCNFMYLHVYLSKFSIRCVPSYREMAQILRQENEMWISTIAILLFKVYNSEQ